MTHLLRFRAPSILLARLAIARFATTRLATAGVGIAALMVAGALGSCTHKDMATVPSGTASATAARTRALQSNVDTIVVIYAENRAFDNLYGNFPGARNLSEIIDRNGRPLPAYAPQVDRNGQALPVLPPAWGGVTATGVTPVVTQQQSVGLPNAP
jgi:phospholipase C